MSKNSPELKVVPFSQFSAPFFGQEGYGIFVSAGANRMQVGSIYPYPPNQFMLSIMIVEGMQLSDYESCELTEQFDSVDAAIEGARAILTTKQK